MNLTNTLRENRPSVILACLVLFSLVSLATGTEATFIQRGIKRAVSITAYPLLKARYMVENTTEYTIDLVFSYNRMRNENETLRQEVNQLKQEVLQRSELRAQNERLRQMASFVRDEPRLTLEPAKVLESARGMLRIDLGSSDGIAEAMAVITDKGVVGVVIEVDDFSSLVATLHNERCKVGAMVERGRVRAYDGMIHPSGNFFRICTMQYIDMGIAKDEVRVGDVVVTSPESIFPSGTPIGKITNVIESENSTMFRHAEVMPFVDPYRLDEVFVVRKALKPANELAGPPPVTETTPAVAALTEPLQKPAAAKERLESEALQLPDMRSMQERYAP